MAVLGSCAKIKIRYKEIGMTAYTWTGTSQADGDCTDNDVVNADWLHTGINGILLGVLVTWTDATAGYDFYVHDSLGIDILHGLGVDLAGAADDSGNRICPMLVTNITNSGMPIIFVEEALEFIGDDMGDGNVAAITLFVRDFTDPKWR